jgi:hypothetical protein
VWSWYPGEELKGGLAASAVVAAGLAQSALEPLTTVRLSHSLYRQEKQADSGGACVY